MQDAVIVGAGPAGLTAAYELLRRTEIRPMVFEAAGAIGGLSKTLTYRGNRLDIGPHRFFSKSDRVMKWWEDILPLEDSLVEKGIDPAAVDKVMLVCRRLTRILFSGRLFPYPLKLSLDVLRKLGLGRSARIMSSYMRSRAFPIACERSLEDFFINRFGRELYLTFFKDYTEKVWGVPCRQISADWGSQRVQGLSIAKVCASALRDCLTGSTAARSGDTEKTLIRSFLYPKLGAGQIWQEVADRVTAEGGCLCLGHRVVGIACDAQKVVELKIVKEPGGATVTISPEYVISTMPIKDIILAMGEQVPPEIQDVSNGLPYRDHILLGLLVRRMKVQSNQSGDQGPPRLPDNWIYIQERGVQMGRVQIINNWSPAMVRDHDTVWLGVEYFCGVNEELWSWSDERIRRLAVEELVHVGFIEERDVLDSVVARTPKAYPAYFGSYDRLHLVKEYLSQFRNLFVIGRNGMHRYNNMDHSVLSAMVAVDNIEDGQQDKDNIWTVNAEKRYLESRT